MTTGELVVEADIVPTKGYRGLRHRLGIFASALVGVGLIVVLLSFIDPRTIIMLCSQLDPRWGLAGALCYGATYLFRAARFQVLLAERRTAIGRMYSVACVHGMLNHLLPMRFGEVSYLYLVRRAFGVSLGEAAVSLLVARLFDYMVVSTIFMIAAVRVLPELPGGVGWYLVGAAALAALAVLGLILAVRLSHRLQTWGARIRQERRRGVLSWVGQKLDEVARAFDSASRARVYMRVLGLSVLVWGGVFGTFYCLLRGLGFGVSPWLAIVGGTFAVLTSVLPLSGVGSFGTLEAGWTAGFLLIGFEREQAIASGFAVHLLLFAMVILLGLVGAAAIAVGRKR